MTRTNPSMACLMTALLLSWQASDAATMPSVSGLNCKVGPITKTYGKAEWLVYGCDDGRTLIVVAAPGNRASPFYFKLSPQKDGYHLTGEGTGSKEATDSAYQDLSKLSEKDIVALIAEAKHH